MGGFSAGPAVRQIHGKPEELSLQGSPSPPHIPAPLLGAQIRPRPRWRRTRLTANIRPQVIKLLLSGVLKDISNELHTVGAKVLCFFPHERVKVEIPQIVMWTRLPMNLKSDQLTALIKQATVFQVIFHFSHTLAGTLILVTPINFTIAARMEN